MNDHKLNIVINRTMESGKWVADIKFDDKNKQTTIIFFQRAKKFSLGQWIADRINGLTSATNLSKKYLQALNFYPDHAFGRKPGVIHIQKTVRQRSIDRKFKEASQTLNYGNSVTGSIGSPFAKRTKHFSAVNVNINDSFEVKQRTHKTISSIFSALEDQGAKISKGNKAYYEGLMEIAFSITAGNGTLSEYGSDAETAVGVLKMFKGSLAGSKNQAVITQVDQLLESLDKKLHPLADNAQATLVPSNLSAREVYGRRPIKPSHLITPKNKTPEP
jgi:hypothetical protein